VVFGVNTTAACELWSAASRRLAEVLRPDIYARWIAVIKAEDLAADLLTLAVENDFYQTWLEENYTSLIQEAIASVRGETLRVAFKVSVPEKPAGAEAVPAAAPAPAAPVKKTLKERLSNSRTPPALNAKYTFSEFIVGPSNHFAHAASLAVAQALARAYNPLFIYGGSGLGKTHLMQAIAHHVMSASRATVCYVSSEAFVNEYIDALQNRSLVQFRKKYRNTDLLLIDDIHFLSGKERMQEEFFHTFNTLFDAHKQIVMTSDRPASEIAKLENRLVTRFEWGLVTELEAPDLETRIAILRHRQAQTRVALPGEVLQFIAENVRSNIRAMEGALTRVASYAALSGKELTQESLQYLLRDVIEQEKHEELTFDRIQRAVAEHYDVRLADMSSKHRPRAVAMPRQVAMYLCRRLTHSSLPEIADAFSKTHATVLHACRAIDSRLDADPELRQHIDQISRKLGRRPAAPVNMADKNVVDACS